MPILEVKNLKTHFDTADGTVKAVDGVSFSLDEGETLGIVGESGSGKSVTALSLMQLNATPPGYYPEGEILLEGRDLLRTPEGEMQKIRGDDVAMIFQDPMTCLNPVFTVGAQISEAVRLHQQVGKGEAKRRAVQVLSDVGIPSPDKRMSEYPHQFSGGMRQRAMIAMALSCNPKVLIADEPTTALDVTIQAQILELMADIQEKYGTAIVMITHDLGVVAQIADEVMVMYAGRSVEQGGTDDTFYDPQMPYTWSLLRSLPRLDAAGESRLLPIKGQPPSLIFLPEGCNFSGRCPFVKDECYRIDPALEEKKPGHHAACILSQEELQRKKREYDQELGLGEARIMAVSGGEYLLQARNLKMHFPIKAGVLRRTVGHVKAVDGVDLDVRKGETLGLVGESGCGKSTLARMILRLLEPTDGEVLFEGENIFSYDRRRMREARRSMQIIFQDPYASLNPRMTVGNIIAEPLKLHGLNGGGRGDSKKRVQELLEMVGLNPEHYNRYPHEFSGGQRQRIGVARAISLSPKLIICDEPVSALDVSIQAQVVNLLQDLQRELDLTYIFVAHDLSVIRHICDRVAVMYLGNIVEIASRDDLYNRARHPYTNSLLSAIPLPDPRKERERRRIVLKGDVPSPSNPPPGCTFHTRCPRARDYCAENVPSLDPQDGSPHLASCFFPVLDGQSIDDTSADAPNGAGNVGGQSR